MIFYRLFISRNSLRFREHDICLHLSIALIMDWTIKLDITEKTKSSLQETLRKKCLYSEFFWSVFSRICTEYPYLSVFSPSVEKYRLENLWTRTLLRLWSRIGICEDCCRNIFIPKAQIWNWPITEAWWSILEVDCYMLWKWCVSYLRLITNVCSKAVISTWIIDESSDMKLF